MTRTPLSTPAPRRIGLGESFQAIRRPREQLVDARTTRRLERSRSYASAVLRVIPAAS